MLEAGIANKTPSYYGGYDAVDKTAQGEKNIYSYTYNTSFMRMIKEVGIDWDKTNAPVSESFSMFTDTFHEPERKEYLIGALVLKNGYMQHWCAEPQVTNVFDAMANIEKYQTMFAELCGE